MSLDYTLVISKNKLLLRENKYKHLKWFILHLYFFKKIY